jgi:hypothetical protein
LTRQSIALCLCNGFWRLSHHITYNSMRLDCDDERLKLPAQHLCHLHSLQSSGRTVVLNLNQHGKNLRGRILRPPFSHVGGRAFQEAVGSLCLSGKCTLGA